MWSNSILNEFPTFNAQYAIELLHSLGSVFDNHYLKNGNLRNVMQDFAKRDDKCFYQLALHAYKKLQKYDSFDLRTIFNEEEFLVIKDLVNDDEKDLVSLNKHNIK
jgi:hypothetical protein